MTKLEKARHEVEVELERRSASIDKRVDRLKRDLAAPGSLAGHLVKDHPFSTMFGFVALGSLAAFLVLHRSKADKRSQSNGRLALADAYADRIIRAVHTAEAKGTSADEALHSAIRSNPPMVLPPDRPPRPSYMHQMTDRLVNTTTAVIIDLAAGWLTSALNRKKSDP
jgi:hypothetical protein